MLHLHGFADYFFQTGYAEWWNERGYDFYALDLRKYGRSLRPHQTPNFVTDLRDYWPEIDEAWRRVTERDGHTHVVIVRALHRRPGHRVVGERAEAGELGRHGAQLTLARPAGQPALQRIIGTPIIKQLGAGASRMREIKRNVDRPLHAQPAP